MAVMVTPRTHCHFVMQARALCVPDSCDDPHYAIMLGCQLICGVKVSVYAHIAAS